MRFLMETISTSKTGGCHFFRKKIIDRSTTSAQLIDLFLKISVLQTSFRWVGDLEKMICH